MVNDALTLQRNVVFRVWLSRGKNMPIADFDYNADLKKYVNSPDAKAVDRIVKFCGIALRGADSRWVSVKDEAEVKRVVDGFCAKKLDLDAKTAHAAVMQVGEKMKADRTKHRVTFYYLLAEHTNTLSKLG
jgi:Protein of unknown function (DUF2853)